jgi:predicted nucleic acid-binding protein
VIVVADATPINILVRIAAADVLPRLFDTITVPPAVLAELSDGRAPEVLRRWVASRPSWLTVVPPTAPIATEVRLGLGEREAIALALERHASLLLADDRRARREALRRGLHVAGTIGVLRLATRRALIDRVEVVRRLRSTDFWVKGSELDALLGDGDDHPPPPPTTAT